MKINYVTNSSALSGVGARAQAIKTRLVGRPDLLLQHFSMNENASRLSVGDKVIASTKPWPGQLGSKSIGWIRLGHKLVKSASSKTNGGIWHLTNQSLSFMAKKLSPCVITVHDLIEVLEPQDARAALINRYLLSGITRADHIIAVSNYTKNTIIEHYSIKAENISVIANGVGPEFHPIKDYRLSIGYHELLRELRIPETAQIVLSVGSDHPRKNVVVALRAFARAKITNTFFVKVGRPGIRQGRVNLLAEIDQLGLRGKVRLVENVTTERLNELYNAAEVLIFPSRFEGFGLPALQAMAAGTPVLTSNATSLPEVISAAGIMHDVDDVESFSQSLLKIMSDPAVAAKLRAAGLARAKLFSWDAAAEQVYNVYKRLA